MEKVLFNLEWRMELNDGKYPLDYSSDGTIFDYLFTDLLNKYKGDFFIDIGKDCIGLEFFYDFPQIFKSIPDILLRMIKNGEQVEFSFTEQDIDLGLFAIVSGAIVELRVEAAQMSKFDLGVYDGMRWTVDRKNFFEEWLKLTRSVLSEMLLINPGLEREESYLAYKEQLDEVERLM